MKESFYINDDDPSVNNLLTDIQVKNYKIYKQSEEDEALQGFEILYEELSKAQQEEVRRFLEQEIREP